LVGSLSCLIGTICLVASRQIYLAESLIGVLGPRAFPGFLSIGLLFFGAVLIFRAFGSGVKTEQVELGNVRLFLMIAAIMIAYIISLEFLGYIIATVLFLGILFRLLGSRRLSRLSTVAIVTSIVLYVGFHIGLHVSLPQGLLPFF
jgi:putative tricarboxylic transport membrane protein